ncbi:tRNA 2-thiouridine(34) synthase MnmA [Candidatus Beckwithbacteria bacterium RBG_13_42_9]|uniref:tRNA-specific 2-thiouridylase MnmA n=1 Tax=Candidatus Beckwithbacteria bacterium RBG_13_42_9 TaxID=1797457 RepID=A0A1F5E6F6_9BACT|nr:MAG: tRNA 2-thiouridine(34) synthase MnmA [Candidatus Beckwithbacteria bacterium RBG_13_42_9]
MTNKKVAIGLSGGVDSAVAAALLLDQGYEVTAVHLVCYHEPGRLSRRASTWSGCRADQDRKDALKIALKLNIPFKVLDFKKAYHDKVLAYFFDEYKKGRTPNPDIVCNQEIKFGLFYEWALRQAQGKPAFDYVATGHYAKKLQSASWRTIFNFQTKLKTKNKKEKTETNFGLFIPKDKDKDQTYFLYRLKQEQLEHLLFPLADLTKKEVRQIAWEKDLPVATKKDSTGICFIGELNMHQFMKDRLGEKPGEVVDSKGKVIGTHPGYWFFTIGQRHGWKPESRIKNLELRSKDKVKQKGREKDIPRLYVLDRVKEKNQIIVGTRKEVMKREFVVEDVNWLSNIAIKPYSNKAIEFFVRIRHRGELLPISNFQFLISNKRMRILLAKPVFGVASGQSAVLYSKIKNQISKIKNRSVVLGGGVIA